MKDRSTRSIFISVLGALIAAAATAILIWGPGNKVSDAVAFILVVMTVVGVGLLISGATVALSNEKSEGEIADH